MISKRCHWAGICAGILAGIAIGIFFCALSGCATTSLYAPIPPLSLPEIPDISQLQPIDVPQSTDFIAGADAPFVVPVDGACHATHDGVLVSLPDDAACSAAHIAVQSFHAWMLDERARRIEDRVRGDAAERGRVAAERENTALKVGIVATAGAVIVAGIVRALEVGE